MPAVLCVRWFVWLVTSPHSSLFTRQAEWMKRRKWRLSFFVRCLYCACVAVCTSRRIYFLKGPKEFTAFRTHTQENTCIVNTAMDMDTFTQNMTWAGILFLMYFSRNLWLFYNVPGKNCESYQTVLEKTVFSTAWTFPSGTKFLVEI